ncbi:hypothetical protein Micbo1qcDRAFT_179195 [Microdochium bolleyi]|uniref:Uncharacterized protein n=1 Tax=Microdochium bolleyi TaxID=196109 RepID=A0A136IQX7_9PEZI|nr:hypothetical protein Micbo1qcDRAFT_179195 [Microdochium bolleyi]
MTEEVTVGIIGVMVPIIIALGTGIIWLLRHYQNGHFDFGARFRRGDLEHGLSIRATDRSADPSVHRKSNPEAPKASTHNTNPSYSHNGIMSTLPSPVVVDPSAKRKHFCQPRY